MLQRDKFPKSLGIHDADRVKAHKERSGKYKDKVFSLHRFGGILEN
jgi:hypothetical protein